MRGGRYGILRLRLRRMAPMLVFFCPIKSSILTHGFHRIAFGIAGRADSCRGEWYPEGSASLRRSGGPIRSSRRIIEMQCLRGARADDAEEEDLLLWNSARIRGRGAWLRKQLYRGQSSVR